MQKTFDSLKDNDIEIIVIAYLLKHPDLIDTNFENLDKGLKEIYRVMKVGGKLAILEPSEPKIFPFKQFYGLYFKRILPLLGKLFSKDNSAYKYLPNSVVEFPSREAFLKELEKAGFKDCKFKPLTFGVAALYTASK